MDELQGDKVGREIVKANMKNKCRSYYLNGMNSNEILKTVLLKDMFAYCDAECAYRPSPKPALLLFFFLQWTSWHECIAVNQVKTHRQFICRAVGFIIVL